MVFGAFQDTSLNSSDLPVTGINTSDNGVNDIARSYVMAVFKEVDVIYKIRMRGSGKYGEPV